MAQRRMKAPPSWTVGRTRRGRDLARALGRAGCGSVSTGLRVNRLAGAVEMVERNRGRGFGVTVYGGRCTGRGSIADPKRGSIRRPGAQAIGGDAATCGPILTRTIPVDAMAVAGE